MRRQPLHVFKTSLVRIFVTALVVFAALPCRVIAQQNNAATSTVPQIIQFSGTLGGASANVPTGTVSIAFTLYENEQGGTALWSETDNVQVDAQGHYTALLGSASPQGLPLNLFTAVQAHWLSLQPLLPGFAEQPRVLLVSAPYALKAGDAETLGGLPASAFLQAVPVAGAAAGSAPSAQAQTAASGIASSAPPAACAAITSATGGASNRLAKFDAACDVINSAVFESGGKVGIGTAVPAATLDVKGAADVRGALTMEPLGTATAATGFNSNPFDLLGSSFNSNTTTAVSQHFRWQAEPVGNNTVNNSGSLNLLYASGAGVPAETGLSVSSQGLFTFAAGQTFPGTGNGTITGVTAGADLTGGGSSGAVTLNLDTTQVPTLGASSNVFTGSITAVSFTGSGAGVSNVNAAFLNGLASSAFQPAGSYATLGANTFTGDQNITGNITSSATVTGGVLNATSSFNLGGTAFALGSPYSGNVFLGFSGNTSTTGDFNTATGLQALSNITSGNLNTAAGYQALLNSQNGNDNAAFGANALNSNTMGGNNTACGTSALYYNTTGINNIGLGYGAAASVSGGGSNNIEIGNFGSFADSGVIRIGTLGTQTSSYFAGIYNAPVGGTNSAVCIDSTGLLGTVGCPPIGNGTITGVTAGADLTGGGSSGVVTLNLDTTQVPTLGASSNVFTGSITAASFTGSGAGVSNVNAAFLNGLASSAFQPAGSYATLGANTFTGDQNVTGNLTASLTVTGGVVNAASSFNLGGTAFAFGSALAESVFLGFAGNATSTGFYNMGSGFQALSSNSGGQFNAASGYQALMHNTMGNQNTATGSTALTFNTTGGNNTATGFDALYNSSNGLDNTANGAFALAGITTGNYNTALGYGAGNNLSAGDSSNIEIGNGGSLGDSGAIRIGCSSNCIFGLPPQTSFFAAGVRGVTTGNNDAVPVMIDSNGQLGTVSSSRRFKEDIHDMGNASEALMRLRPVTFRYKKPFDDGSKPIQYGLIAEEVAQVYPDMVARSADGQIETVKYQLLDPMLLNELQRQQKEMVRQQSEAQLQQAKIRDLEYRVKTQQALLSTQQAQIAQLASQMKTVQASLRSRHKAARPALASAPVQSAPTHAGQTRANVSPASGGN